jgi:hypothetical protein
MAKRELSKYALALMPDQIARSILVVRGHKVLLDSQLASFYGVETKVLNQAVKRNQERFPEDFMFQLSEAEFENWRSQIVTSNPAAKMGLRRKPLCYGAARWQEAIGTQKNAKGDRRIYWVKHTG